MPFFYFKYILIEAKFIFTIKRMFCNINVLTQPVYVIFVLCREVTKKITLYLKL